MNIFEKMLNITNEIGNVNKNLTVGEGANKYKAVGEADILKAVKELEMKYKVYSYPYNRQIVDRDILKTRKEYKGQITESNKTFMRLEVVYRFVNIEKPDEYIDITTYGDGIDSCDKAPGKAMTYSDKYALLKAYKIITGDDPDQEPSEEDNKELKAKNEVQKKETQLKDRLLTDTEAKRIYNILSKAVGEDNVVDYLTTKCKVDNTSKLMVTQYNFIVNDLKNKEAK